MMTHYSKQTLNLFFIFCIHCRKGISLLKLKVQDSRYLRKSNSNNCRRVKWITGQYFVKATQRKNAALFYSLFSCGNIFEMFLLNSRISRTLLTVHKKTLHVFMKKYYRDDFHTVGEHITVNNVSLKNGMEISISNQTNNQFQKSTGNRWFLSFKPLRMYIFVICLSNFTGISLVRVLSNSQGVTHDCVWQG